MTGGPACPCGHSSYDRLFAGVSDRLGLDRYRFEVWRCSSCGLARTLPTPDPEQYAAGYSLTTCNGRFAGETSDGYSDSMAAFVAARMNGRRLLDVGCHVGNLVAAAAARGLEAEGIDLDPLAVAAGARVGRPLRTASIEQVDGAYDVVVMSHVLEHVVDLRDFLGHISRILSPTGRAFVFSPHYRGLMPRLMGERWMGWFPSQHVWHFTLDTLTRTVAAVSPLRVVSCTTRGVIEPPSARAKGYVKAAVARVARAAGWGDQVEAVLEREA